MKLTSHLLCGLGAAGLLLTGCADADPAVSGDAATANAASSNRARVASVSAVRWVRPGDATTEDYSPSRLNVMLDVGGTIASVHCG